MSACTSEYYALHQCYWIVLHQCYWIVSGTTFSNIKVKILSHYVINDISYCLQYFLSENMLLTPKMCIKVGHMFERKLINR